MGAGESKSYIQVVWSRFTGSANIAHTHVHTHIYLLTEKKHTLTFF